MKKLTILFILGVILMGVYFYTKKNSTEKPGFVSKIKITEQQEEVDANVVVEYFVQGMSVNDFENALKSQSVLLFKPDENYSYIYYNFEKNLKYSEIEEMIKQLNHSKAVRVETIGESADKRNLYSLEIGFGKKVIMFEAGIHAAEVANTMFIMKYIKDLVNDYEKYDETVVKLLNEIKIVVFPAVNPDGYEACLFGFGNIYNKNSHLIKNNQSINFNTYKANINGIDLNRSMPSQHAGLYYQDKTLANSVAFKPSLGNRDYYAGAVLGSEPETKSLINWQYKYLSDAYAYVALHSAGRVIYAGKPNLSDKYNENSLKLASIVSEHSGYQTLDMAYEDVGLGDDGTATDFASEIIMGFNFNAKTGRLSTNHYAQPKLEDKQATGVITIETMTQYTYDISSIKNEYYERKLSQVFDELLRSHKEMN